MKRVSIAAGLSLALALLCSTAQASDEGCYSLSDAHKTSRFGTQYLLVKDGDQHLKVSFVGNRCGLIAVSPKLRIKTGGESGRLCSSGTVVSTPTGSCRVSGVETIDAEEFQRLRRQN